MKDELRAVKKDLDCLLGDVEVDLILHRADVKCVVCQLKNLIKKHFGDENENDSKEKVYDETGGSQNQDQD